MLPEPRNAVENQYVANSTAPLTSQWFYLGLKLIKTTGVWVWRSDGSEVTWNAWRGGEPPNGQPNPELAKCGAMTDSRIWSAPTCDWTNRIHPVICERHITRKYNRHHEKKQTND